VKRFVSIQFLNVTNSAGLPRRVISPSQGRYLTQTENKHRHPCLEWDSNPRTFERAKTFHGLDRAATLIDIDGHNRKISYTQEDAIYEVDLEGFESR
jgi:hypothetical protein